MSSAPVKTHFLLRLADGDFWRMWRGLSTEERGLLPRDDAALCLERARKLSPMREPPKKTNGLK